MAVHFKCKSCDGNHMAPFQTDKKSLESLTFVFQNNYIQCPATGFSCPYNKEDLFWKLDH